MEVKTTGVGIRQSEATIPGPILTQCVIFRKSCHPSGPQGILTCEMDLETSIYRVLINIKIRERGQSSGEAWWVLEKWQAGWL